MLVGAGPGDPELLTLSAVRALQSADVILFDDLVVTGDSRLRAPRSQEDAGRQDRPRPACKQDDINALMVSLAKAGSRVVRLKGGDPMIFGRADEEIAACRAAGIAVDVVPGITSAQGAASRLGVADPPGKRAACNTSPAMIATANCRTISTGRALPIRRRRRSFTCRTKRCQPSPKRCAAGLDPATPAVAVAQATRADERTIAGNIAELPALLAVDGHRGRSW